MEQRLTSPAKRTISAFVQAIRSSLLAGWRSRHISNVLLVLVLLAESGVVLFVMRDLGRSYSTVEKMYNGSVQGLLRFGDIQYEVQETRGSTLHALSTNDGNLQVDYADQSRNADKRVAQGIAQYLAEARTDRESKVGRQLAQDWSAYLEVRDQVLGLILEGSPKEAAQLDLNLGVPEFDRVRQDLEQIKQTYADQAFQQLATVADVSRQSTARLIAALLFGLFFGTGALWAIQRSRMRNAVQLAQLQMDFVASVSHELRTPLTAILTAGENIRDGLALNRERVFEQGSVITEQANQLMGLVDQVLQFSAGSEANFSPPLHELRVNEIIEHALRSTQSLIQDTGFTVEVRIDLELPPITADLHLLSQCLQNLIVNALKYSKDYRWIAISARMNGEKDHILISVQDRGIGISSSEVSRVFEPFYRSPEVIAARIQGTGLGLSIAKRNAEVFGGELTVFSEINVGSVFTVQLPVAQAARRRESIAQDATTGARV